MSDHSQNKSNDRPSTAELLGTAEKQIERQGESVSRSSDGSSGWESDDRMYQTFIGIASITLVVLGIIALGSWLWIVITSEDPESQPTITPADFIYTETTREIDITEGADMESKVKKAADVVNVQPGGFLQFYFTATDNQRRLVSAQEFFNRLSESESVVPIIRYMGNDFMYGIYNGPETSGKYLIFSITDSNKAYGSLLQSESELINSIQPLGFTAEGELSDAIIQNQDVRFATSSDSTDGIYYAFPQSDRLVITTDEATLRAVFDRLEQAQFRQQ